MKRKKEALNDQLLQKQQHEQLLKQQLLKQQEKFKRFFLPTCNSSSSLTDVFSVKESHTEHPSSVEMNNDYREVNNLVRQEINDSSSVANKFELKVITSQSNQTFA